MSTRALRSRVECLRARQCPRSPGWSSWYAEDGVFRHVLLKDGQTVSRAECNRLLDEAKRSRGQPPTPDTIPACNSA